MPTRITPVSARAGALDSASPAISAATIRRAIVPSRCCAPSLGWNGLSFPSVRRKIVGYISREDRMKITRVKADIANLPADEPLADAPGEPNTTRPIVVLDMATDDGIEGLGVTFFGGPMTGALRTAVDELGALIVGMDPTRPEAIAMKLRASLGTSVLGGLFTLAQSAIDMALWDIRAKALNLPLWRMLGGARDR